MTTLRLYSEPFAKTGNMAAEGFRRLLGRPTLGLLQTVLRESIQNVLDATKPGKGPVVLVRLRTLSASQKRCLDEVILAERPLGDATKAEIDAALSKSGIRVLEICDFGTEGLSGPTRADAPHDDEEPLNFVNFLRNVGAARDTHQGGGTYGYGKSALYAMSSCSTIVVDSQTSCAGVSKRRLMACHLGAAFDAKMRGGKKRRFTGRHWWGVLDGNDSVDPVSGSQASRISERVGMPPRDQESTGTSILIVDPLLNGEDLSTISDEVVETILWNFWPRMTKTTPKARRLTVKVEVDGTPVVVPKPEDCPPLDLFAEAMAAHRQKRGSLQEVRSGRPNMHLGLIGIQKGVRAERSPMAMREGSVFPKQCSHIALMRPVELVVKYIEGDPFPDRRFEWAGVFICSDEDEVESAFASAEPPAHDDWIPDNLPKGREKTFVRVALRELDAIARMHAVPASPPTAESEKGSSLAATATRMGRFLNAVTATGPGRQKNKGRPSPSGRKSVSISPAKFAGLVLDSGQVTAVFKSELRNDGSVSALHVRAEPFLIADGGSVGTDDLAVGMELKVSKMSLAGEPVHRRDWIHVGALAGEIEVRVPVPRNAAIGVRLELLSGAPR